MVNTIESVIALLGRKLDKNERFLFDLQKDDSRYFFVKGKNGFLESHLKPKE